MIDLKYRGRPWAPRNGLVAAFWSREAVAKLGTWYGRLGTGLNATMVADASVTAGTGLLLDGTGDYAALPAGASVAGLAAASIALWYKPTAAPSGNACLWWESTTSTGYTRFALFHLSDNTCAVYARDTATGSSFGVTGPALTAGTWVHLAATYNSVTDYMQLYVNGTGQTANTAAKGPFPSGAPYDTMAIGAFVSITPAYINGIVDNVFLWTRALSAGEVAEVMQRSMRK